VIILTFS